MTGSQLLVDAFGRIPELVHGVLDGLSAKQLSSRLDSQVTGVGTARGLLVEQDQLAGCRFDPIRADRSTRLSVEITNLVRGVEKAPVRMERQKAGVHGGRNQHRRCQSAGGDVKF